MNTDNTVVKGTAAASGRLRILSFTTVFPRPRKPRLGIFVQSRLRALQELAEIVVVSPEPVFDFGDPGRSVSFRRQPTMISGSEPPAVVFPRWIYPPSLGWTHPWWLATCTEGAIETLRREFPFQIIDAHFGHPEASAAFRLARRFAVPFTVTMRGNETFHGRDPWKRKRMAEALRAAARVITVSAPLRDFAIELGVEPERAVVIPNGIDAGVFHPRPRAEARRQLGMDESELHILSAGYLIERKGHHRIVECLPDLHACGLRVRLWIVGDPGSEGDYRAQIQARVSALGLQSSVTFVPSVPGGDLARYMSACDLFCLATSREGWPNVVNEALACGAPVVATDVGGVPAMISDPRFGIIVPAGDRSALSGALARALTMKWDREAISHQGLSRSWEQVAKEVFEQLAAAAVENRQ